MRAGHHSPATRLTRHHVVPCSGRRSSVTVVQSPVGTGKFFLWRPSSGRATLSERRHSAALDRKNGGACKRLTRSAGRFRGATVIARRPARGSFARRRVLCGRGAVPGPAPRSGIGRADPLAESVEPSGHLSRTIDSECHSRDSRRNACAGHDNRPLDEPAAGLPRDCHGPNSPFLDRSPTAHRPAIEC